MKRKQTSRPAARSDKPPPDLRTPDDNGPPPRPHPLHQLFHAVSELYKIDETLAKPYTNPKSRQAALDEFRFHLGTANSEVERLWVLLGKDYRETLHD